MTPEAKVARIFRARVKQLGGWCIKVSGIGKRGLPDYLVLLDGELFFVELKASGGRLTEIQRRMHEDLADRGARVYVLVGEAQARLWIAPL